MKVGCSISWFIIARWTQNELFQVCLWTSYFVFKRSWDQLFMRLWFNLTIDFTILHVRYINVSNNNNNNNVKSDHLSMAIPANEYHKWSTQIIHTDYLWWKKSSCVTSLWTMVSNNIYLFQLSILMDYLFFVVCTIILSSKNLIK